MSLKKDPYRDGEKRKSLTNFILFPSLKGEYGCLNCLNKGYQISVGKRVFIGAEFIKRTEQIYEYQLMCALRSGVSFEGIKDRTFMTDFIYLTHQCFIDYMHASLEGNRKSLK